MLAVGTLVHEQVGPDDPDNRPEANVGVLVVCTDRFIKANSAAGTEDEVFPFPEGIQADWATITHPSNVTNRVSVLLGYEVDGERAIRLFRLVPLADPALFETELLNSLADLGPEDLVEPIHTPTSPIQPLVQVRADNSVRVRFKGPGGWRWHPVLTTATPERSVYAPGAKRVITGERLSSGRYGFWITDIDDGRDGLDLWQTEPTFEVTASELDGDPQLAWVAPPGIYPRNFLVIIRRVGGDGDEGRWVLTVPNVRCREP